MICVPDDQGQAMFYQGGLGLTAMCDLLLPSGGGIHPMNIVSASIHLSSCPPIPGFLFHTSSSDFSRCIMSSLEAKTKGRIPHVSCTASRALNAFSRNPTFSTSQKWEFLHFPPGISCCKAGKKQSQTRGHLVKKSLGFPGSFLNWKRQNVAL